MTDHVFALGTATTTPITLDAAEDVLAATADTNDELVLVTSRRVIVIADDAQLSCDFADRATGTGPARACVARKGERIAALLWRGDEEGTKPEAAFFEVQERLLRRTASGRKTSGRVPRWLLAAKGAKGHLAAITRCGALVQLSWRGKSGEKAKDMRVVPAAVGTDLQVFDARSSDSGRVAAVVRQRSEMHRNAGAFVALLEPDKNRRRRVCEMTSLSFGEPRGCDIERSGERVVVAWEHGVTVHNFDGGEPLLARVVERCHVRWVPHGDAFAIASQNEWHLLSTANGTIARGSLEKIKTLACGATQVFVCDEDGVTRIPLAFNDGRTPILKGRDHVVCVKGSDAWPRCSLDALGLEAPARCCAVAHDVVAVAGSCKGCAIADLTSGVVTACFPSDHVMDVMWCFPLLLAVTSKSQVKCFCDGVHMAVDGTALTDVARCLCARKDGDTYHVAYASSDDTAKAFSLRPGKVVQGEDKFFVCEMLPDDLVIGPRGRAAWANDKLIVLDHGIVRTNEGIVAKGVEAIASASKGIVLFSEQRTWAWFPGDVFMEEDEVDREVEAVALEDLDPFRTHCGFAGDARVVVQALRQNDTYEPIAHMSCADLLGAVVRACVSRCSARFAASVQNADVGTAFDHFAAAENPLVDGDIREASVALAEASEEDVTNALANHVAESAALASRGDAEAAFASRALLWLARHVLKEGGLLRVACRAARPLEPDELEALFYHGRALAPSSSALDAYARLDAPRGLFTRCLHLGELGTAAELLPLVSAGLYDDDGQKARSEMLGASRELLWRTLGGRDDHAQLEPVWRFARRCEGSTGDNSYSRIDVTFCDWDDADWDARTATTDEVACRAIARHLACATPSSIRRAAACCVSLQNCEAGWPDAIAVRRCVVKFRYQQGSVLKHVVAHALDSLVAAFGEEVILGLVSTKDVERLDSQRKLCEALLAFCSSYKIDGFRAALSISLNVHAQNVAPKLASAIYKAFERSGAAPDVVSRAEQGAVFAAHAHQRSFGV